MAVVVKDDFGTQAWVRTLTEQIDLRFVENLSPEQQKVLEERRTFGLSSANEDEGSVTADAETITDADSSSK